MVLTLLTFLDFFTEEGNQQFSPFEWVPSLVSFAGVQGQFDKPSHFVLISLLDIFYFIFFNCETKSIILILVEIVGFLPHLI